MATGNLTISANVTGAPAGSDSFGPFTIVAPAALPSIVNYACVGATPLVVPVPTGYTCAVLVPPNVVSPVPNPPYTGSITYKTTNADTGLFASPKNPSVIAFDPANYPTNLYLTVSVSVTLTVWYM
jgi:hypothetical protein